MLEVLQGQEPAKRILGGMVQRGRVPQVIWCKGPEGVGKALACKLLMAGLEGDDDLLYEAFSHGDVHVFGGEGSLKVGMVRDALEASRRAPLRLRRRYIFLQGCDALTPTATNALLKTLEEPPPYLQVFLFSREDLLGTLAARAFRVDFLPLEPETLVSLCVMRHERMELASRLAQGSLDRLKEVLHQDLLQVRDLAFRLLFEFSRMSLNYTLDAISNLEKPALRFLANIYDTIITDLFLMPHDRLIHDDQMHHYSSMKIQPKILAKMRSEVDTLLERLERPVMLKEQVLSATLTLQLLFKGSLQ